MRTITIIGSGSVGFGGGFDGTGPESGISLKGQISCSDLAVPAGVGGGFGAVGGGFGCWALWVPVVDVVVRLDPTVNLFPFVTIVLSRDDTYRRYIGVVLPVNLLKYY
jgi:hypothetical protein